ncbi:MAG: metallophosphoesterase [Pseudomonadota bacterium]|nr:metallophosphoesterase [Pseudomonadota bacterium]
MDTPRRTIFAALLAAGCGISHALCAGGVDPLAAFVVLGQTGKGEQVALARVLIDKAEADCPSLEPAEGKDDRRAMTPRRNPDPENFKVTVCEALYPADGSRMEVGGTSLRLPSVPAAVTRIAVFGDTGCQPGRQKDCKKDEDWPFPAMADAAARADPAPDLVMHLGDYNYRGTPGKISIKEDDAKDKKVRVYDAGDNTRSLTCTLAGPYYGQNSVGSESPDSWKAWKDDFFEPAAKLLSTAPWVFARGNHELCSRAGPGWFYFLDPGSNLVEGGGQLACPPAESAEPLIFRSPYRVDLGGLSMVVLDSANACDQGNLHQGHFNAQFEQIQSLVKDAPAANAIWLQSHRPLWGLREPDDDTPKTDLDVSGRYAIIDKTLQSAFANYPVPKPVHLVLSGHMHRFQTIGFEPPGALPTQLIIGSGGVDLESNYPEDPFSLSIGDATAVGFGLSAFGYMDIALKGAGDWTGRMLDRKGNLLVRCDSGRRSATGACSPAGK